MNGNRLPGGALGRDCFGFHSSHLGGDFATRGINNHLHQAELKPLAMSQAAFLNRFAFDESAIGRAEVLDEDRVPRASDFAVKTGDRWIFDLDVIGTVAPYPANSRFKVQFLRLI